MDWVRIGFVAAVIVYAVLIGFLLGAVRQSGRFSRMEEREAAKRMTKERKAREFPGPWTKL
jgi:uncharacterized membrane protein